MNNHVNKKLLQQEPIATIFKNGSCFSIVSKTETNQLVNIMFSLINVLIRNDEKQKTIKENSGTIFNPHTGKLITSPENRN